MTIYEQMTADLKTAMKAGDKPRVEALRFALSVVNNFQKEKFAKQPDAALTDEETVYVLQKEAKRRKDSIELFKQGNRADLVAKEEADLAVIQTYLPQELSRAELEKIVEDAIAGGAKDFNSAMREAMKIAKGRADGKVVGEIIKAKLG